MGNVHLFFSALPLLFFKSNSCTTPFQPVYAPNGPNNEKEQNRLPQQCRRHNSPNDSLCQCIDEVKSWMCQNFLQLNKDNTEVIVFGNKDEVLKVNA